MTLWNGVKMSEWDPVEAYVQEVPCPKDFGLGKFWEQIKRPWKEYEWKSMSQIHG
jgi:hypothetical protein